ncbi:E3 ubiquitin-protein ligase RING1-like [Linum grandiflorum]
MMERERRRARLQRIAELARAYTDRWPAERTRAGPLQTSEDEIRRERGALEEGVAEAPEEVIRNSRRTIEESQEAIRISMRRIAEAREAIRNSMMERERRRRARRQRIAELASSHTDTLLAQRIRAVMLQASEDEIGRERGASKAAIEKLEVVADYGLDRSGEDCCSICLAEMGGRVIRMECKHVFHQSCLMNWLKTSKSCPLCRFQVSD